MAASICSKCGLTLIGHVMRLSEDGPSHFDCGEAIRDEIAHLRQRIADHEQREKFSRTVIHTQQDMLLSLASKLRAIGEIIQRTS